MVNTQEYINKYYPTKAEKEKATELKINKSKLEGELDLSDFVNLERLDCSNNQLTSLKLTGLKNLHYLDIRSNQLTDLKDITNLENPEKLKELYLSDNNFPEQDLSQFSKFINLEILWIGNYHRETKENIYNRFTGSLKPLKDMNKLEELEIGWTDVDSGLEHLPKSVVNFWCYGDLWKGYGTPENKSKKFNEDLKDFRSGNKGMHDLNNYWGESKVVSVERKIKDGAVSIWRHSIVEEAENLEIIDTTDQSVSAIVFINKKGGLYAVRVVTYEKEKDEVSIILADDTIHGRDKASEIMKLVKKIFLKSAQSESSISTIATLKQKADNLTKENDELQQKLQSEVDYLKKIELEKEQEQAQRIMAENNLAGEKERNQLLQETNELLVQKSTFLETQLKSKSTDKEISDIEKQLRDTEKKLAESKKELVAKQEEIDRMKKEKQKEEKGVSTGQLETILDSLESSFKHLEGCQGQENQLVKSVPRLIMDKIKTNASDLGTISRGINYVGGGISTLGYAEIGGGITLFSSTVDSVVAEIEKLDKKKQEELVKLEGTCQELKKIYRDFSDVLVLPRKMDETISKFLESVNELQKSISSGTEQKEINKGLEKLKEESKEVKKDLKKVIKNLEVKVSSPQSDFTQERATIYMGGFEQEPQIESSSSKTNQEDLQAVIVQDETTPLLPKTK